MKCSLGTSNFLEEIASLSHSVVFLYFFALIPEEGFLMSPCYSLELCIQMGISFLFSFAFCFGMLTECDLLEKGMANHFTVLALRTLEQYKWQNDRILKQEVPRLVGAQYATGDRWRNNSRKNEGMEPKQKQYPVVDVTGDRSKVRCCKEQYCIGIWNVRSMNQGTLEVVK